MVSNCGLVFLNSVVIDDYGGSADIRLSTNRRIANIRKVRDFRALSYSGVLNLNEGSDFYIASKDCSTAKM